MAKKARETKHRRAHLARQAEAVKAHADHVKQTEEIFNGQRKLLEEKERKLQQEHEERQKRLAERRLLQHMVSRAGASGRAAGARVAGGSRWRILTCARQAVQQRKQMWLGKIARVVDIKKEMVEVKKEETLMRLERGDEMALEYRKRKEQERARERKEHASHRNNVKARVRGVS
jgi:hypothetical protein